jgi:hypothetical protein
MSVCAIAFIVGDHRSGKRFSLWGIDATVLELFSECTD